jgi:hypothetical protein
LIEFREQNGHCRVAHSSKTHPELGRWVKRQRYQYKLSLEGDRRSTMTQERVDALESIGFVWDPHSYVWDQRLQELKAFYQEYNHINVPTNYPKKPLLSWIKFQRQSYKKVMNTLTERQRRQEGGGDVQDNPALALALERFQILDGMGFEWMHQQA